MTSGVGSWKVGERAVIDRRKIVTIERVTPSGRAIAAGRTFEQDGSERAKGSVWRSRSTLEGLTPEIEAEMALVDRGHAASSDAFKAVSDAARWLNDSFSGFGRVVPQAANVDAAARLASAIREVLKGVEK